MDVRWVGFHPLLIKSPFVCELVEKLKSSIKLAAVVFFDSKIGLGLF
jgi:hypothetical protein